MRAGRVEVNRGTTVSFRDERQVDRSAGLRLPTRGEAGRGRGEGGKIGLSPSTVLREATLFHPARTFFSYRSSRYH